MKTLVITQDVTYWQSLSDDFTTLTPAEFLTHFQEAEGERYRIINLTAPYQYQSIGYYVSLLAEARHHKVIPSVATIQDIKNTILTKIISWEIEEEIQRSLRRIKATHFDLSVYFGRNTAKQYDTLCQKLHHLFPVPLFRVSFKYQHKQWKISAIKAISEADIPASHQFFAQEAGKLYFGKQRFHTHKLDNRIYDLAILIDPEEEHPPSNKKAIKAFCQAAHKLGLSVELITHADFKTLAEYDGLFIRTTTAVNHYTYKFARRAFAEGMVVIDDPVSILRCTNKIYLYELLRRHKVDTPKTLVVNKYTEMPPEELLPFPFIMKLPDSAFSKGVIKIEDTKSYQCALKKYFSTSELILLQEFMPTAFDWRIGVLDNQVLYACKYYMAQDHWQIYNWSSVDEREGFFETVAIDAVPKSVRNIALRATKLIGNGLYGVDIKMYRDKPYIIEINDNPNLDGGIEDQIVGKELYLSVMKYFLKHLREKHATKELSASVV